MYWCGMIELMHSDGLVRLATGSASFIHFLCILLQKKSLGEELYEKVFYHLDLVETDYFGLQFTDVTNVTVGSRQW